MPNEQDAAGTEFMHNLFLHVDFFVQHQANRGSAESFASLPCRREGCDELQEALRIVVKGCIENKNVGKKCSSSIRSASTGKGQWGHAEHAAPVAFTKRSALGKLDDEQAEFQLSLIYDNPDAGSLLTSSKSAPSAASSRWSKLRKVVAPNGASQVQICLCSESIFQI
jgi:hypothetical protein